MITEDELVELIRINRTECYVKRSADFNPYRKSDLYDWEFRRPSGAYLYTDAYRGFNPYSGVEYLYETGRALPVWSCDYVGYVLEPAPVSAGDLYAFLKEARGHHLADRSVPLFMDYRVVRGELRYETAFLGDLSSLLQTENFYFGDRLVAQQVTAGRLAKE